MRGSPAHRFALRPVDLDVVVAELNDRFADSGLEAAQAVGSFLLDTFFAGSAAVFRARQGQYDAFRQLTRRADLRMSYSFLWTSIAVVEQLSMLPPEVAKELPLAHHRALLTIKDPELKVRVARHAIENKLSKRELERRVRRVRPSEPKRGRKRTPESALERAVRDIGTALTHLRDASDDDATLALRAGGEARARLLLRDLDQAISEMGALAQRVRDALG